MTGPRSTDGHTPDPLELFGVLAQDAPDLGTADDLAEVRRAVTAMRRGRRLVGQGLAGRQAAGSAWLASVDWRRAAAVGVLSGGLLSLAAGGWRQTQPDPDAAPPRQGAARVAAGAGVESSARPSTTVRFGPLETVPAIEEDGFVERRAVENLVLPASASVYRLEGETLDLVMVVDETLDV